MSQVDQLYAILSDGKPHRSDDLVRKIYDISRGPTLARLGARIYDVKRRFCASIASQPDLVNPKLWWYQLAITPQIKEEHQPRCQASYASAIGTSTMKTIEHVSSGQCLESAYQMTLPI